MTKRQLKRIKQLSLQFNLAIKNSPKDHKEAAQIYFDSISQWLPEFYSGYLSQAKSFEMSIIRAKRERRNHQRKLCGCFN